MLLLYMFRYTLNVVFKRRSMPLKIITDCDIGLFSECWLQDGFDIKHFKFRWLLFTYCKAKKKCRGGGQFVIFTEHVNQYVSILKVDRG